MVSDLSRLVARADGTKYAFRSSFRKPKLIVPRPLRFDVPERLNSAGEVLVALDDNVVVEVLQTLSEQNVELWPFASYTAMQTLFMKRTASLVRERLPNAFISSHAKSFLSTVNLNV